MPETRTSKVWTPSSNSSGTRRSESSSAESAREPRETRETSRSDESSRSNSEQTKSPSRREKFFNAVDKFEKVTGVLASAFNAASAVTSLAQTLSPSRQAPQQSYGDLGQGGGYVPYPSYDPYADYSQGPQGGGYAPPSYSYDAEPAFQQDMGGGWDRDLSMKPNQAFTYGELKPYINSAASKYGVDPNLIAGMLHKESTFTNWIHHKNPQAHGLIGVTEKGMLPEFEAFASEKLNQKVSYGKGANAAVMHPELQIEFLAKKLDEIKNKHGLKSHQEAAGMWWLGDFPGAKAHLGKSAGYQQALQKSINAVKKMGQ